MRGGDHPLSGPHYEDLGAALDDALYADDPVRRDAARGVVARRADPGLLGTLTTMLDAPHRMTRRRAGRILAEVQPERAVPVLVAHLEDTARPPRLRAGAARVLSILQPEGAPALGVGLTDADPRVRRASATRATPVDALLHAVDDVEAVVVDRAVEALEGRADIPTAALERAVARLGDEAPEALLRALARARPRSPAVVASALRGEAAALDHIADPETIRALLDGDDPVAGAWGFTREPPDDADVARLLAHPDSRVRAALTRALGGDDPRLAPLAADPDPGVAWLARRALDGAFAPDVLAARTRPHAMSDAPSARPPYGLQPEHADAEPAHPRAHAALALCHTRFDVNLGVAMRSAEAAGFREIVLVGRGDFLRSPARGVDHLLPVRRAADTAALVRLARASDYQIVGVQQTPDSVPYHEADYPPRPLFVVGAEDDGLPGELRRAADLLVEIPMFGVIDSLNVAACATCVMFRWRLSSAGGPR